MGYDNKNCYCCFQEHADVEQERFFKIWLFYILKFSFKLRDKDKLKTVRLDRYNHGNQMALLVVITFDGYTLQPGIILIQRDNERSNDQDLFYNVLIQISFFKIFFFFKYKNFK